MRKHMLKTVQWIHHCTVTKTTRSQGDRLKAITQIQYLKSKQVRHLIVNCMSVPVYAAASCGAITAAE